MEAPQGDGGVSDDEEVIFVIHKVKYHFLDQKH